MNPSHKNWDQRSKNRLTTRFFTFLQKFIDIYQRPHLSEASIMDEHHIDHRLTPKNNICTAYPVADSTKSVFYMLYL